jgi:hypothetical protein
MRGAAHHKPRPSHTHQQHTLKLRDRRYFSYALSPMALILEFCVSSIREDLSQKLPEFLPCSGSRARAKRNALYSLNVR